MLEVRALSRIGLSAVSFQLEAGECLAVRGPSGAGKSLLLRAVADLDPSEGDVLWQGRERRHFGGPEWRGIVGYLPAEPGWWGDSVGEHFRHWPLLGDLRGRLGIPDDARDWPITRPSTGERMRLALIRALERKPKVLLLDEPTAALDAKSVAAVEELIAEKRRDEGLAALWVTHDEGQGGRVASRILAVEKGHARLEGA
ncbi:MAG TPA: ATP-binding cassette domain-containing protein [Candidatus Sulfotelmatobacter sp.]|jgi:phosphate-transporting ATPase|nr:ATP-binding cassette domain-containing protein [Candidatus Sulfotelmatobacter sp.]